MRIMAYTALWVCVQVAVILFLESIGLRPSLFLRPLHGVMGGILGLAFLAACLVLCIGYTFLGVYYCEDMTINSREWWSNVAKQYLLYMLVTLVGLLAVQGRWFFEGYGYYIVLIWIAPILWLGELEAWEWIRRMIEGKTIGRRKAKDYVIETASSIFLILIITRLTWVWEISGPSILPEAHPTKLQYETGFWCFFLGGLSFVVAEGIVRVKSGMNTGPWCMRVILVCTIYMTISGIVLRLGVGKDLSGIFRYYLVNVWAIPPVWLGIVEFLYLIDPRTGNSSGRRREGRSWSARLTNSTLSYNRNDHKNPTTDG